MLITETLFRLFSQYCCYKIRNDCVYDLYRVGITLIGYYGLSQSVKEIVWM